MNRKSIEYVLTRMGVDQIKMNGDWMTMSCPLAPWTHASGTDSKPSFGVRESQGISGVHCFSCGYKGGLLSLVRTYGNHATREGLWSEEEFQEVMDYVILAEAEDEVTEVPQSDTEVAVPEKLTDCLVKKHAYFEERGIEDATIRIWHLGYVHDFLDRESHTSMRERVLFPVYDKEDLEIVLKGIVGRSIDGEEPKYKNVPPNFRKSKYVYGGWLVGDRKKIIVVEGPMDCLKVTQMLIREELTDMCAVALLGASPSKEQVDWLKAHAEEVICMLDNDPSGKLGQKKLIDAMDDHAIVSVVHWEEQYKDPDEAEDVLLDMIRTRKTVLEYRLEQLLRR